MAAAETYTVVCTSLEEMENLPPEGVMVYSVRFGERFATREQADAFANRLNDQGDWHHYSLTTAEAQAVLAECGTFALAA